MSDWVSEQVALRRELLIRLVITIIIQNTRGLAIPTDSVPVCDL